MNCGDLKSCLSDPDSKIITFPNICVFALQIASALYCIIVFLLLGKFDEDLDMHSQTPPVCHRDLKSPNCLVTLNPDSDEYSCKVSDFGLSRKNSSVQFVGSKVDNPGKSSE